MLWAFRVVQQNSLRHTAHLRDILFAAMTGAMRNNLFMVAALCSLVLPFSGSAAGQSVRIPSYLALARICVSEAGWDCFESGDGLAIHEVLLQGADREGMSYVNFARAYSGRVMGTRSHSSARLAWVSGLNVEGTAPGGWPRVTTRRMRDGMYRVEEVPPWSHYRERWMAVLDRAREVVRLSLDSRSEWSPCQSEVHDWGGTMDRSRAERIGLIPVECGETSNDFYARPSLVGAASDEEPEREDVE